MTRDCFVSAGVEQITSFHTGEGWGWWGRGWEEGGRDGGLGAAHVPRPHKLEVYSTKPGVSGESVTLSLCLLPNI